MSIHLMTVTESGRFVIRQFPIFEGLRSPISVRGAVRAGEHDRVTVRIAQPTFPVVRTTPAIGRIAMARPFAERATAYVPQYVLGGTAVP